MTGTIAVYEDTPAEEVERLEQEALQLAGGIAPPVAKVPGGVAYLGC